MTLTINLNILVHDKVDSQLEEFMATVKETLEAIDAKTNTMATEVAAARQDLVDVKALIAALKAGQTDPALAAQADAILSKITQVETDLGSTEADLKATGQGGQV